MRPGTRLILARLNKSKAEPTKPEQWVDLVDDVLSMGRDEFLRVISTTKHDKPKAKTTRAKPDALGQQVERYRKKSGLNSRDFLRELHSRLATQLPKPPPSALTSVPKFLAFARQSIADADLEAACASVTDAFA